MRVGHYTKAMSAALLSLGLAASVAHAVCANPFGGEDPNGCIPPDAPKGPVAKCENVVGKANGKLALALVTCHAKRALGKLPDVNAEELCESTARAKYGATKLVGCTPCTEDPTVTATSIEAAMDHQLQPLVYCDATGTPFNAEDDGYIPTTPAAVKCANLVATQAAKLLGAEIKCHALRVLGKLADANAEELCESTAQAKFQLTKTLGCTPCVDMTATQNLIHTLGDADVATTYCAE